MWNTDLLESVSENFYVNFMMKEFLADKQFIIWWINLEQWDSCQTRNKNMSDECLLRSQMTRARHKHTPRKSMKHLAQGTGMSKSSANAATQLLKLRPYKTTVIHALQPHNSVSRVHFWSWFLQSIIWDWSTVVILIWWSMVSLAGIHK
jgi:hypothetical protein